MYGHSYGYGLGETLHNQDLGGYGGLIESGESATESEPSTDYFLWGFAGIIIALNTLGWGYICWRTRKHSAPKSPLKRGTMWTECIALERHQRESNPRPTG